MQIHFERSGGFMGRRVTTVIDTETLPPEEAREWQQLVEATGFFELPSHLENAAATADQFHYRLRVINNDRQHTLETSESALPPALEPLLARLRVRGRQRKSA
ncbi:MAG: hypothetical protein ONB48_21335 [candidate division KSB1 bacterium]|nr:hypothetical protein [candidate division KSB1 bacterium]MDZ7288191.1 hypothetical protein [candidate division KSB1 bacterium]MDZ7300428.1 hypothetical protein [candidate division KSB1 bacterium]MDZ7309282.1 hypothetical protein [candidate division KSB1 bacterium]MDZ7351428.1 hypothetical protein [candidate division KSB1 bacterium]